MSSPGLGRWGGDTHTQCLPSLYYGHKILLGNSLDNSQAMVYQSGVSPTSCGNELNLGPRWEVRPPQLRSKPRRHSRPGKRGKLVKTCNSPQHSEKIPFLNGFGDFSHRHLAIFLKIPTPVEMWQPLHQRGRESLQ